MQFKQKQEKTEGIRIKMNKEKEVSKTHMRQERIQRLKKIIHNPEISNKKRCEYEYELSLLLELVEYEQYGYYNSSIMESCISPQQLLHKHKK